MDKYTLIRRWEGKNSKPVLKAYRDSIGKPTIGYGHTKNVNMGDVCTEEQAEQWLLEDCADAEKGIKNYVKVPLNDNQYAALLSFTFNLGSGALARSTLLHYLNEKNYISAGDEFGHWIFADGKQVQGLINRRAAEKEVWNTND